MNQAIRKGGVAIITGAAVGIGHAIAHRLAQEGMKLVLLDRDGRLLTQAAERLHTAHPHLELRSVAGDVTSESTYAALSREASALGETSILVNNAAILKGAGPYENLEQWRETMEINFWSILRMQQYFVGPLMAQTSTSAIINVGSKEGITTRPGNAAYALSKAAVRVLTEQLAHELREQVGDRVTAHLLIPGYTFTPMNFPSSTFDSPKPHAPWSADQVADRMVQGVREEEFYIFCEDNEVTRDLDERRMQWAMDDLIKRRPALSRWHPRYKDDFEAFVNGCDAR
jgi:NAD(P)-dependent dehydrogenase (short-subunit alcohol dehydrogenase family)